MVGVLVLVDQHVPEPLVVLGGQVRERLQQVDGHHDQVVEVHRARRDQPALVLGVGLAQGLLPVAAGPGEHGLVVDQLVLQVGDLVDHRLGRKELRVQLELAADHRHQPLRVGLVVDREAGRVAEAPGLPAQDPDAGRVEGHQPHRPCPGPGQRRGPGRHLAGRLVGERDGEDLVRLDLALGQQVGDPVRQDPRLARARPGHDEQRAALVQDGSTLLRVQPVQEGVDNHRGHVPKPRRCRRQPRAATPAAAGSLDANEPAADRRRSIRGEARGVDSVTRPAPASAWTWSGSPCGRTAGCLIRM